jgi:predicted nucleic acid-binding protein
MVIDTNILIYYLNQQLTEKIQIKHRQVIMSRNEDDFIKIAGLTVNNPFS